MNIESLKIDLAKQLFSIQEKTVLDKIKTILDKEEIVAYTVSGEPLTKQAYIDYVNEAEKDFENGNFLTQEQLLEEIKSW